jgi:hypothetical protein
VQCGCTCVYELLIPFSKFLRLALNTSMELVPTVVSGRWFHSRVVLWKEFLSVIIEPLLEEPMLTSGSAVTRSEV